MYIKKCVNLRIYLQNYEFALINPRNILILISMKIWISKVELVILPPALVFVPLQWLFVPLQWLLDPLKHYICQSVFVIRIQVNKISVQHVKNKTISCLIYRKYSILKIKLTILPPEITFQLPENYTRQSKFVMRFQITKISI